MSTSNGNKGHILVVDDDDRLRQLLHHYLQDNGYVVTQAINAAQARELLTLFEFNLMILDVMMPGETGLELARNLPQRRIQPPPILMLTAMNDAVDRINGLEAGVEDYLSKPFEPRELLLRIENILRRVLVSKPAMDVTFGEFRFQCESQQLTRQGQVVMLTQTEAQLLTTLCEQPGQPVSREILGERLDSTDNLRTVDVHIGRLRKKIEANTAHPRYVQTVRGAGYKLVL